jgi:4-hydroxy-3-methylbut-2-enyl diphosphate reductase
VYHEIVHNRHVVSDFQDRGVVFVESIEDVPEGANLLYSAHGVSPQIRELAQRRRLRTIDATCPLVAKVHSEAVRFARGDYTIVLIGHEGHDEIVGVLGEAPSKIVLVESPADVETVQVANPNRVAYLTQTTLSVDDARNIIQALKRRFPNIVAPPTEDICYATQNRQQAVREMASQADFVLVIGSQNSSNAARLVEVAVERGAQSRLIDDVSQIDAAWFDGVETVVVTAGASTPERLVDACLAWFEARFQAKVERPSAFQEEVRFALPKELRSISAKDNSPLEIIHPTSSSLA